MDYAQLKVKNWLKEHKAIQLSELDELANLSKGTIFDLVENQRPLSEDGYHRLVNVLLDYGYQED